MTYTDHPSPVIPFAQSSIDFAAKRGVVLVIGPSSNAAVSIVRFETPDGRYLGTEAIHHGELGGWQRVDAWVDGYTAGRDFANSRVRS